MKKIQIYIFLLWTFYIATNAQITYPGSFEDYHIQPPTSIIGIVGAKYYSPYGIVFTPKGTLKILIVCVGFGEPYDSYDCSGWAKGSTALPDWVNNKSAFYTSIADFNNPSSINDKSNISRFYYEMSKGNFKLIADVVRVNVNATGSISFAQLNAKAINQLGASFNWGSYDNRGQCPNYLEDNSITPPNMKPDYIITVYRYTRETTSLWWTNPPVSNMHSWFGVGGGYAALNGLNGINLNGYTFNYSSGYTQCLGTAGMYGIFIHEVGHSIFDCPHYACANGVVGYYFYGQIGAWGMMNLGSGPFGCATGWERWYLGWIELLSSGVNSNVNTSADLPTFGEFTLRDFITTGDVVRIKIPNGTGTNQYLWLENHQGLSLYDDRNWGSGNGCVANALPPSARGLVAYIESIDGDRNNPFGFWNDTFTANGIKPLHSTGNYDYSFSGTAETSCLLWQNPIYNINEGAANPLSGEDRLEGIRLDFNQDNVITLNTAINSVSPKNEIHWVAKRNGNMTYDFMGSNINFSVGQKIGMATNPVLINRPLYDNTNLKMSPYYLNGISVTVYSQEANGDIKVRVAFNDVNIGSNLRWTGNIVLPDITNNTTPDLILSSNCTLTINKSGTSNRHTKTTFGDFINLTTFTCTQNSFFKMQSNSNTVVDNLSTLTLESGSAILISDDAVLTIKNGSTFQVKNGAGLIITGSGRVEVESGGYICIEPGTTINVEDGLSVINLHPGYNLGVNTSVLTDPGTCISYVSAISKTGNGSINTFDYDNYVQNQVISINSYLTGLNIFAGTHVTDSKPQGPVVIQNGANAIFDAEGNILLDKGFEVQLGASFETK